MNCNFTYNHLEEIIELARSNRYTFKQFSDIDFPERTIIFRHDIDLSIEKAYKLAKKENLWGGGGIKSTYFFHIDSAFYNIFEKDNLNIIQSIHDLGHHIGLHYNEHNTFQKDLKKDIFWQIEIMEKIFGFPLKAISFHRPSQKIIESNLSLEPYKNCYSNLFFKEFKYLADSRSRWPLGCPCNYLNNGKKIQILIHPIWWEEKEEELNKKFNYLFTNNVKIIDKKISENISIYKRRYQ